MAIPVGPCLLLASAVHWQSDRVVYSSMAESNPAGHLWGVPMPNEADTCRRYVVPRLQAAGWEDEPHRINEQVTFTDGRIVVTGRRGRRKEGKRADYILRYRPDFPIAVVEAKPT